MDNKRKRSMEAPSVYPTVDEHLVRKELANMILLHKYPLSIVNHVGFKKFSRCLNPYFQMVSRQQVKEDILKSFNDERSVKNNEVDNNVSRIAVTMDLWITQDEKRLFAAATAHFIDGNWRRKNFLFEFRKLPYGYTEKSHMDTYLECLSHWMFDDKLATLTFDDCFDAEFLKETYSTMFFGDKLILGGKFLRMRCFTVSLKALVGVVSDTFMDVITKIQGSVDFWTATPIRQTKFRSVACKLGLPLDKNLTAYCKNQWDSVYLMLERAVLFKDVFKDEKLSDSGYTCIPSEEDWNLTKEACEILKLFYETASFVSGRTYHVSNEYFEKICGIKLALAKWVTSEVEVVKCMASNMVEKFDEYWTDVNTLLAITAILDPRYKMFIVEYYFTKIYKDGAQGEIDRVRNTFSELFQEYSTKVRLGKTLEYFNATSRKDDFKSDFDMFVTERKKKESVITELEYYLDGDILPRNDYFDILSWWRNNGLKYPILQMIARDVLAIPVSKAASNAAVFCTAGNVLEQNFNKLSPKTIEALMCKRNWLTADLPGASVIVDDKDSDYDKE